MLNPIHTPNWPFKILTLVVSLILLLPNVLQHGLFMDGLMYAAIANNLANGIGSFWEPRFSSTVFSSFHEHPPLVFGLQSIFFRLFGDSFMVEKIYSLGLACITAAFIISIWKKIFGKTGIAQLYWLPVLFWITVPKVFWSVNNNMLENTMGLFSLAAFYLLLVSINQSPGKKIALFTCSSGLLFLAFLSKGFPGLFPLVTLFFYYWIFGGSSQVSVVLKDTILLVLIFAGLASLFLWLNDDAFQSLSKYFNTQVMASIEGKKRIGSRFIFFKDFMNELIIMFIISSGFLLWFYQRNIKNILKAKTTVKSFVFFIITGFTASLPLMVSPKLSVFYAVPSFPFFALGFAALIAPILHHYIQVINTKSKGYSIFKYTMYFLLAGTMVFSITQYNKCFRDKALITDVKTIGNFLPEKTTTIKLSNSLVQSWNTMGYFQRYFHLNLDKSEKTHPFALVRKNEPTLEGYQEVSLLLSELKLLKRNE